MKTCCMCKEDLPEESFKKHKTRGLQSQCIACQKEYRRQHYLKNRRKYIKKAREWKKEFISWWKEYKATFRCQRCGEDHPACIHFHHENDDKEASVCDLVVSGNKDKVLKEIAKCIPLCANCHAKEHWSE